MSEANVTIETAVENTMAPLVATQSQHGPSVPLTDGPQRVVDQFVHYARHRSPSGLAQSAGTWTDETGKTYGITLGDLDRLVSHADMLEIYAPEITPGAVAVRLGEESDWEAIAEWCGGTIHVSGPTQDGEYSSSITIPDAGEAWDGAWIVRHHDGTFTIHGNIHHVTAPPTPEQVWDAAVEFAAKHLEELREMGGRYGQTERRPSNYGRAAQDIRRIGNPYRRQTHG